MICGTLRLIPTTATPKLQAADDPRSARIVGLYTRNDPMQDIPSFAARHKNLLKLTSRELRQTAMSMRVVRCCVASLSRANKHNVRQRRTPCGVLDVIFPYFHLEHHEAGRAVGKGQLSFGAPCRTQKVFVVSCERARPRQEASAWASGFGSINGARSKLRTLHHGQSRRTHGVRRNVLMRHAEPRSARSARRWSKKGLCMVGEAWMAVAEAWCIHDAEPMDGDWPLTVRGISHVRAIKTKHGESMPGIQSKTFPRKY